MDRNNLPTSELPWVLLVRSSEFYTLGLYLERALQRIVNVATVYVETAGPWGWIFRKTPTRIVEYLARKYLGIVTVHPPQPSLILVVDPVRKKFDFSKFDAPTAFYAIDSHVAFREHVKDAHVQDYDYVFVAQKDDIPKYREAGCEKVYWLPFACDPEIHKRWDLPLRYDICFVGKLTPGTEREQLVRKIEKSFGRVYVGNRFLHDMARIYSQSKIVLNKSLAGDLNMRVFETLSCGRFLLTDRIANGLEELFRDKIHLVTYDDFDDLVDKARYYLDNEREREKIALQGLKEVHKKHTYLHRAEYLLRITVESGFSQHFSRG